MPDRLPLDSSKPILSIFTPDRFRRLPIHPHVAISRTPQPWDWHSCSRFVRRLSVRHALLDRFLSYSIFGNPVGTDSAALGSQIFSEPPSRKVGS